ncbi:hypothetical protein FB451DRAFT_1193915 [Mycena latifolia]|nr:hypothetical protein FB451DRAFT_1193915 [Mycena latifolia]
MARAQTRKFSSQIAILVLSQLLRISWSSLSMFTASPISLTISNIDHNLRRSLGEDWANFVQDFWAAYRAVSPTEFERLWAAIVARYANARSYLQELYIVRDRWAWAWVETENRVTNGLSGSKNLFQVFTALNERTRQQAGQNLTRARESSRKQHPSQIDSMFTQILTHLREHVGPFALNTSFKQMEASVFYQADVLQLPEGTRTWTEHAVRRNEVELGYQWERDEENHAMNDFINDDAYIETRWLLRLIQNQGLVPVHLLKITHMSTGATHIIAILPDGRYVCDCCMGLNLGQVCRHYYAAWTAWQLKMPGLPFHISLIRARWYQNPRLDIAQLNAIIFQDGPTGRLVEFTAKSLPAASVSNPISTLSGPPQPHQHKRFPSIPFITLLQQKLGR